MLEIMSVECAVAILFSMVCWGVSITTAKFAPEVVKF